MKIFEVIDYKLNFKIPVWILLSIPFAAYLVWEGYWYTKVGLRVIKWHTHVVEYIYLWLIGVFIFRILSGKNLSEKSKGLFLTFSSVVFALFLLENFLQVTGLSKTYMEQVTGDYYSPYLVEDKTHYHTWPKGKEHWIKKPEYTYWRPTNSLGLPDVEWPVAKRPGEKRMMALGDSFTEGDGSPYDSTYVALLKQKLWASGDSLYVMNAGVLGSDPFFNYKQLKDQLLIYRPDIIIQSLSAQDMLADIVVRGGMERFQIDGTVKFLTAPWWEPIFAISYINRLFFRIAGYNEFLRKKNLSSMEKERMDKQMIDLFKSYSALCKQNHIRLIVMLRPDLGDYFYGKYYYDFSNVLLGLKSDGYTEVIDLLPAYKAYVENNNTDVRSCFWPKDGHHNSKGYEMMAETIFDKVAPLLNDPLVTEN